MGNIIRTSIAIVLCVWAYLSASPAVKGPMQDGFAVFLVMIALLVIYPVIKEINGHLFPEPVKAKKKKFRPHAIYEGNSNGYHS